MRNHCARPARLVLFSLASLLALGAQVAEAQGPQKDQKVYVLRPRDKGVAIPDKLEGLPVRVIDAVPEPRAAPTGPLRSEALRAELTVAPELQMTANDRQRLRELNRTLGVIRKAPVAGTAAPAVCGNHEAIGTVVPGVPLQPTDTAGTWVSMPIAQGGINGLSGWIFTPFSNIAAQTLEVLGAYGSGNKAELSVFDWSCVDGKQGSPTCDANTAWTYVKSQQEISSRYKFYYWDCCRWVKAFALANKSRYVTLVINLPFFDEPITVSFYLNEAKILNWDTMSWHTFYYRAFEGRDAQPPRPWGPTAFVEFISNSGCPDVPRLGFREVRFLPAGGGAWTLAVSGNSTMRFDLPDHYRYCLFDPNHTWCVCLK